MDSYGFLIAAFLVTMGGLGDRIGRRRLLLVGAAAFGVASVVAALATSPVTLIVARAVLGLAAATLMPSTLALCPGGEALRASVGLGSTEDDIDRLVDALHRLVTVGASWTYAPVSGRWAPTPDPRELDSLGVGRAAEGSGCGRLPGVR